jgi:hypothetical protein
MEGCRTKHVFYRFRPYHLIGCKIAFAFSSFCRKEWFVVTRIFPLFTLLLVMASCDQKQKDVAPGSGAEPGKRTTRADRPPRDVLSGRDKLRAAFDTAKAREPGGDRDQAIAEVAKKALDSAPDMAAEIIRELSPGAAEKEALMEAYIRHLLEEEKFDEALTWADSLGNTGDIAFARGKALTMLAQKYPEQATQLLSVSEFAAGTVNPVTEEVLQTWALKSPADALAWTTRLPAGETRTAGYRIAFAQWFDTDPKSALMWVASQNNSSVRQEAVSAMIGLFIAQPGPIREAWLGPVDPNLRAEIEQGIAEATRQDEVVEPTPEPEQEMPSDPQPETVPEPQSQSTLDSSPGQEIEAEPAEEAVESE